MGYGRSGSKPISWVAICMTDPEPFCISLRKSQIIQERRTSIVATYYFIRQNDLEDTFKIGEILVHDKEDSINKAVGSWIREAGKRDQNRLFRF